MWEIIIYDTAPYYVALVVSCAGIGLGVGILIAGIVFNIIEWLFNLR